MQSQVKVRGLIRHLPDVMSVLIVSAVFVTSSYTQTTTQPERLKHTLAGHSAAVSAIAFSPDGQTVANAVTDNTVRLVTVKNGELPTLKGHAGAVIAVAFSPDGRTVASASVDKTVKLWDVSDTKTTR